MTTTPQPEQPQAPDTPPAAGRPLSDQPHAGQPYAGQPHAGQPHAGQAHGGRPYPGQAAGTAYPQGVALDPSQQRTFGMLSHLIPLLAMVLSAGVLGFVGSLVVYVLYKDRGDFVRQHAANSLNIQIMTGIVLLISFPLMLILVGFLTYGLALVIAFVFHVIGAMKANNGERWDPPLTPRFVK